MEKIWTFFPLIVLAIAGVIFWTRYRALTGQYLSFGEKTYLQHLAYSRKRRYLTPSLGISIQTPLCFIITTEKWHHRFLKSIGMAEELQTGDATLDNHLFFACDTPDTLGNLLQKTRFQNALRLLFTNLRAQEVRLYNDRLWVKGDNILSQTYTPTYIDSHLSPLKDLADSIRGAEIYSSTGVQYSRFPRAQAAFLMMGCHMVLLGLGVLSTFFFAVETTQAVSTLRLITVAGGGVLLALLIWLYLVFGLIGRSSWLPAVLGDFCLMGLIGIILLVSAGVWEANVRLDKSPAVIYTQALTQKTCDLKCSSGSSKHRRTSHYTLTENECAKGIRYATQEKYRARDSICRSSISLSYTFAVPPWQPSQNKNYTFSVSDSLYDRTRIGDKLSIPVHPGALKISWLDTKEIQAQ